MKVLRFGCIKIGKPKVRQNQLRRQFVRDVKASLIAHDRLAAETKRLANLFQNTRIKRRKDS